MKLFGNRKKEKAPAAPRPPVVERPPVAQRTPAVEKKSGKGKIALIAALIVAAALAAGAAAGTMAVNGMDTIFPNVTVDGVDVGGLTPGETAEKLLQNGYGSLEGKSVSVVLPADYVLTLGAEEVCSDTPVADVALMAWDACHGGGAVKNALTYLRCLTGGLALESGASVTVDEGAVRAAVGDAVREVRMALLDSDLTVGEDSIVVVKGAQGVEIDTDAVTAMIVEAFRSGDYGTLSYEASIQPSTELDVSGLYDTIHAEAADAYYDPEADEIVAETVGVTFDVDEAKRLWEAASYGDRVVIPLEQTEPEITGASLNAVLFRDKLGSMATSLAGSTSNRVNNVEKASESINGIVLMPGDSFSYNDALGQRTPENGYLMAGAYAGGQVVQEYGGGICQVSSTLYYCALKANLQITSRTCHYFPVSYLPAGLDATVSWGGPEFRFVNDREYPIRIKAWVDSGANTANVEIWGTDVDGSYVEMTYSTWYYYDDTWTDVALGYKAQTYRNVYDAEGELISRKPESASTYHYHEEDIRWPEEALATPEPEETEAPPVTEAPEETEAPPAAESPEETESPPPAEGPAETPPPAPEQPVGETGEE